MSTLRNIVLAAHLRRGRASPWPTRRGRHRKADAQSIARGRYIAKIAGCNDCHTAGYALSGGKVPEKDWLHGRLARLARRLGHDVSAEPAHRTCRT